MADGIVLSESDRALLQSVLDRVRRDLPPKTARHHEPEAESYLTPEVYAVLSPSSGIPARVGLALGSAECDVYRVTDGVLEPAGFTRTVWNLAADDQPGGEFLEARRDKFGTWLVGAGGGAASGSGSGVGRGTTVSVVTNVCGNVVEFTALTLPPGTTVGARSCVTGPTGCCGGTGTGTGTGTGGTGAGGGTVTVTCCSQNPVPQTLHLTVTSAPACLAGNFTLTWDAANNDWRGPGSTCSGHATRWRFFCVGGAPQGFELVHDCLDAQGNALTSQASGGTQLTAAVCSPFHVGGTGTTDQNSPCYADGQSWTWNVVP